MARFTVDDCLEGELTNRFDMTLYVAKRAHKLDNGATPLIDNSDNDKPIVVALKETAQHLLDPTIATH